MGDTLREYSGVLLFNPISGEMQGGVLAAAKRYGLEVSLTQSQLEFSFIGRDSNRFVERFLADLATLLVNATGEIACEQDLDGRRSFEFYSIKGGELYRQVGRLERGERVRVLAAR